MDGNTPVQPPRIKIEIEVSETEIASTTTFGEGTRLNPAAAHILGLVYAASIHNTAKTIAEQTGADAAEIQRSILTRLIEEAQRISSNNVQAPDPNVG